MVPLTITLSRIAGHTMRNDDCKTRVPPRFRATALAGFGGRWACDSHPEATDGSVIRQRLCTAFDEIRGDPPTLLMRAYACDSHTPHGEGDEAVCLSIPYACSMTACMRIHSRQMQFSRSLTAATASSEHCTTLPLIRPIIAFIFRGKILYYALLRA